MGNVCAMLLGSGADDSDAESAESAPLVVAPREPHSATLIFLHGLGDTGHGWRGALADLGLPGLKVVLPTAAERRVTLNGGMRMPAWFDIHGLTPDAPQDKRGIAAAAGLLAGLVERELAAGVPAERVVIGGFSQGGAVALHLAFSAGLEHRVGGVMGLSTWLPLATPGGTGGISSPPPRTAQGLPTLMCHGTSDPLVPAQFGKASATLVQGRGAALQWREFPGLAHSSCASEMEAVGAFLQEVLG